MKRGSFLLCFYFSSTRVVTERAGRAKASVAVPLSVFAKSLSLSVT